MDKRGMLTVKEIIELVLLVIIILGVIIPVTQMLMGILTKNDADALSVNNFNRLVQEMRDIEDKNKDNFSISVPLYLSKDASVWFYAVAKTGNKAAASLTRYDVVPGKCKAGKSCVCLKNRDLECMTIAVFDRIDFAVAQAPVHGEGLGSVELSVDDGIITVKET
jgi:hypothetical protein